MRKNKAEQKKKLRSFYLNKRNHLAPQKRKKASERIWKRLCQQEAFCNAKTIFFYVSYQSEVETKEMMQHCWKLGKKVAVPKVSQKELDFFEVSSLEELICGYHGILEPKTEGKMPIEPNQKDLFVLPGLVFGCNGERIGYGGGYYDRYIDRVECQYGWKPYCIGIGYQCQLYPGRLQMEKQDKKMDCILTESSVIIPKERKFAWLVYGIDFLIDWIVEVLQ